MGNLGLIGDTNMNRIERLIRAGFSSVVAQLKSKESSYNSDNPNWSSQNQAALIDALNDCTASDTNLFHSVQSVKVAGTPVAYIPITENNWFSLGVFVIFENHRLPLHDHPGMFGALKIIYGRVRVRSYSVIETAGKMVKAYVEPPVELNASSPPAILQPNDKNIHEIEFVSGEAGQESQHPYAAFIDFLSPPYTEEPNKEACNYYELQTVLPPEAKTGKSMVMLRKCPSPNSYWSVEAPYQGFPFDNVLEQLQRQYPKSCNKKQQSTVDSRFNNLL